MANIEFQGVSPAVLARDYVPRAGVPFTVNSTDANGNITSITYSPPGGTAVTTTYSYNADGTIHTETTNGVTITYAYDANGLMTGAA